MHRCTRLRDLASARPTCSRYRAVCQSTFVDPTKTPGAISVKESRRIFAVAWGMARATKTPLTTAISTTRVVGSSIVPTFSPNATPAFPPEVVTLTVPLQPISAVVPMAELNPAWLGATTASKTKLCVTPPVRVGCRMLYGSANEFCVAFIHTIPFGQPWTSPEPPPPPPPPLPAMAKSAVSIPPRSTDTARDSASGTDDRHAPPCIQA